MENIPDDNMIIPEVKIGIHRFKIRGSEVFCMLMDDQVPVMEKFFEKLEMGGITWQEAKDQTLNELIRTEFKNCPDHLLDHFKVSGRSAFVFHELEKSEGIQNLIKSINRDNNIDGLFSEFNKD
jgi:hypothetical protein